MDRIEVHTANGGHRVWLTEIDYSGEYMGECYVQSNVKSATPVDWKIGDYLDYRGERFTINYIPACKVVNEEWKYQYDNVKFDSVIDELVRCTFKDVVPDDNEIHWTGMDTFSFYAESVKDLANRIQANLDFVYGKGLWTVVVDKSFTKTKPQSISVDNKNIWDGLSMCYDNFKANFIVRGRTITIGTAGTPLGKVFKFGMGNGLKSLERTSDSSQVLVTRLRAYGNTTNIPTNFYKYVAAYLVSKAAVVWYGTLIEGVEYAIIRPETSCKALRDAMSYKNTPTPVEVWYLYLGVVTVGTVSIRYGESQDVCYAAISRYDLDKENYVIQYITFDRGFMDWRKKHPSEQIEVFGSDFLNMSYAIKTYPNEVLLDWPNNMAVTRLMLPGFPYKQGERSLGDGYTLVYTKSDVYIDSPRKEEYGLREGTVYIDGTDNDSTDEDIYPSLEDVTKDDLVNAGLCCNLPRGDNGHLDQIAASTIIDDDGDNVDGILKGSVAYVWTKDIGFNPKNYLVSDSTAQIFMKSGMCAGYTFDISSILEEHTDQYTRYRLTLNRKTNELGFYLPNKTFKISAGDEFVLLGIRMPNVYVTAASERLLKEAMRYIKDNDKTKFTFTPALDPIFMERDRRERGKDSLYWNMKEGDVFEFSDSGLDIMGALFISSLGIKESCENPLPEYDITLEEKKSVSTLTKVANQVSASLASSTVGGMTPAQVDSIISSRAEEFLKRKEDDTASGQINVNGGLVAESSGWEDAAADGLAEWFETEKD